MATRNPDEWFVGTGRAGGRQTIVRALKRVPYEEDRGDRNLLMLVTWTYADTPSGMPSGDVLSEIDTFEAVLFASLDAEDWATEAAAITGNGAKQWRFYAADAEDFVARFSKALTGHPVYPITLEAAADPDWQGLSELQPG